MGHGESVEAAGDSDAGLAERVSHLRLAKTRSVVFEGKLLSRIVETEAAQAVSVGEFAEMAQLVVVQRGLQFVSHFYKCHGEIIPATVPIPMNSDVTGNHLI